MRIEDIKSIMNAGINQVYYKGNGNHDGIYEKVRIQTVFPTSRTVMAEGIVDVRVASLGKDKKGCDIVPSNCLFFIQKDGRLSQ